MTGHNFDQLGQRIAREQDALLEKHNAQAEVRQRLAGFERRTHAASSLHGWLQSTRVRWTAGAGALALAAAAVAVFVLQTQEPSALTVQLSGDHQGDAHGELRVGEYVHAPNAHASALQFSDGSHIELAQGGRARLLGLRASGADVSLESGHVHVKVQHRQDSSWHIGAGPFVVHVTGTRFEVGWKPESDSFELTLHEGRVELSGCSFGAGYRVLAGQTVHASCRSEQFQVTSAAGAAAVAGSGALDVPAPSASAPTNAGAAAPIVTAEPPVVAYKPAVTPKASVQRGSIASSWQMLARAGHYAQALTAVRALGFEQESKRASADELSLLANVARYGQDSAHEAEALQTLRVRFQGSKRAALAAFALGRLEFDNHAAYPEAAEWFRIYLKEQPRGDLAREASGRLLEATQRSGDNARARELAERYLRDYPQGPHAQLAQGLLQRIDAR